MPAQISTSEAAKVAAVRSLGEGRLVQSALLASLHLSCAPAILPAAYAGGAMHYVYMLQSQSHPGQRCTGFAADLKDRMSTFCIAAPY
jgi:hypothetical protein